MNKSKMVAWLENRREDEEIMASTINTEHPNYLGSEEEDCYLMHQSTILMLQSIIKYMVDSSEEH